MKEWNLTRDSGSSKLTLLGSSPDRESLVADKMHDRCANTSLFPSRNLKIGLIGCRSVQLDAIELL